MENARKASLKMGYDLRVSKAYYDNITMSFYASIILKSQFSVNSFHQIFMEKASGFQVIFGFSSSGSYQPILEKFSLASLTRRAGNILEYALVIWVRLMLYLF